MAFDHFFKQLLQDFLSDYEIHSDEPVGKLPLKVDLVIKLLHEPAKSIIPLLENLFKMINLFEYKSSHDKPKKHDLSKLIGYLGLYCDHHTIGIDQIQSSFSLWYVSVKRPKFVRELLKNHYIKITATKGLYQLNVPFPCPYHIMIINELDITIDNIPLLLLSSGETLKTTINFIAQKKQSILPKNIQKNIKLAIEDIGLKEVIHIIGLEEVIKAVGLEEVIKAVGLEEVIKAVGLEEVIKAVGLEEVIKAVGLEEVEKVLKKLKGQS
ncbi:MAG: hypothetical protein ACTSRS_19820 [Candidatus Helarchaeota archaeon]